MSKEKLIDMGAIQNCQNLEESYGEICVKCNKCRRFTEAEELFSILSNTMNGANLDDLNDAVYRILDKANYHKRIEGEWNLGKSGVMYFCSSCGYAAHPREEEEWNFCPRCGAKMKGE